MNFQLLQEQIENIVKIADSVPEVYRLKCFEILLNSFLVDQQNISVIPNHKSVKEEHISQVKEQPSIPIKTQLRIFMSRTNIEIDLISSILLVADGTVHFIREPANVNIRKGQNQWALLLALRNMILYDTIEVDPEDVRSICKEKGFYDQPNFSKNFHSNPFASYFKSSLEPQGKPQTLTQDGMTALAELIKELAG
jgi:hypothetical protein